MGHVILGPQALSQRRVEGWQEQSQRDKAGGLRPALAPWAPREVASFPEPLPT